LVDDPGLGHLDQEIVALARPLADAAEDRDPAVLARDVVDQLLDQNRLAAPGAAEEADLAAAHVRRDQIHDLEARLEDRDGRRELVEGRRGPGERPGAAPLGP